MSASREDILKELHASRGAIIRDMDAVGYRLNVKKQFQDSFQTKPLPWLLGAMAVGVFLVRPRKKSGASVKVVAVAERQQTKKKKDRQETFWTFLIALLKILVPVLKPALSAYAAKRLAGLAENLAAK